MPFGKLVAIAGAVVLAPLVLMVAFSGDELDITTPTPLPAAVSLSERPIVPPADAAPEQHKETKTTPTPTQAAEPKALFQPASEEAKPRPTYQKPGTVPVGTGADRDCTDFSSHEEAQRFFLANGGPSMDPHKLDRDNDGLACEST